MSNNQETVVLYHRACNDGLGAAWAAWKVLPEGTQFIDYQYGEKIPAAVDGKHLILVDLSLTPEQVSEIYPARVKSVMIIDHHKTAIEKLGNLPAIYSYDTYLKVRDDGGTFMLADTGHSGAVLSWTFFNNKLLVGNWKLQVPMALRHLEDYDLWKFNFEHTDAINAYVINRAKTIEDLDRVINSSGRFIDEIIPVGNSLIDYDQGIVKSVAKSYVLDGVWDGFRYAVVNAPHHLRNRMSDHLLKSYDMVVCYTHRKHKTVFSLRSKKGIGCDTTKISQRFGGGGHAVSSSFSVDTSLPRQLFVENPFGKPTIKQRMKLVWWALTTRNLV